MSALVSTTTKRLNMHAGQDVVAADKAGKSQQQNVLSEYLKSNVYYYYWVACTKTVVALPLTGQARPAKHEKFCNIKNGGKYNTQCILHLISFNVKYWLW